MGLHQATSGFKIDFCRKLKFETRIEVQMHISRASTPRKRPMAILEDLQNLINLPLGLLHYFLIWQKSKVRIFATAAATAAFLLQYNHKM